MADAPARSAPGQPAGHRPGAHRRRSASGLRPGAAALRRHPRAVVHPRRRGPGGGPDAGRTRGGRALRDASQRLRARVHLRRGQRRFPQRLRRPREPGRAGTSGRLAGRRRHRGQQPPRRLAGAPWPRTDISWPNGTRAWCTSRSPATDHAARGRSARARLYSCPGAQAALNGRADLTIVPRMVALPSCRCWHGGRQQAMLGA
jgi:hypothetical protein